MSYAETWKPVRGFEGKYEVSDNGRVRSLPRTITRKNGRPQTFKERILRQHLDKCGYPRITLDNKNLLVHRLVAEAFLPNKLSHPTVNHIDGDKTNAHVTNLEWCTHLHNVRHAFSTGLLPNIQGSNHPQSKLTEECVKEIKILLDLGERQKDIAEYFNVDPSTISNIKRSVNWAHLGA